MGALRDAIQQIRFDAKAKAAERATKSDTNVEDKREFGCMKDDTARSSYEAHTLIAKPSGGTQATGIQLLQVSTASKTNRGVLDGCRRCCACAAKARLARKWLCSATCVRTYFM